MLLKEPQGFAGVQRKSREFRAERGQRQFVPAALVAHSRIAARGLSL